MHVLAFSGRTWPGRAEEAAAIFNEEIIGKLRKNEHYREAQLYINPDGQFLALFRAADECGPGVLPQLHDEVRRRFEELIQGNMRFRQWEVVARDVADERERSAG